MKSITFYLKYISNFKRKDIGIFTFIDEDITQITIYNHILSLINKNDELKEIPFVSNPKLFIIRDSVLGDVTQLDIEQSISTNEPLTLVFSNLVLPCGAVEVQRIEGISLYFNSNERNHSPHIHAKYAEEEISVDLKPPYKIRNKMKKEKLRIVIQYIDDNLDDLLEKWELYTNADRRYK